MVSCSQHTWTGFISRICGLKEHENVTEHLTAEVEYRASPCIIKREVQEPSPQRPSSLSRQVVYVRDQGRMRCLSVPPPVWL